jgi:large subunit ribosomal protein L25
MAGKIPDLHAEVRTGTGKGAARTARRAGNVPGIVYGGGEDPQPIQIPFNTLLTRLRQGRFLSTLFNLKISGNYDVRVVCRNVQRDVVKDLPTHLDLMRLKRDTRLAMFIPVTFINEEECPGLAQGGVLTVVRNEVELSVIAGDIPEEIIIDLAAMEIGDIAHISEVKLPEGARPTIDRDFVIANVSAPTVMAVEDDVDEAEDGEAVEGEDGEAADEEATEE